MAPEGSLPVMVMRFPRVLMVKPSASPAFLSAMVMVALPCSPSRREAAYWVWGVLSLTTTFTLATAAQGRSRQKASRMFFVFIS